MHFSVKLKRLGACLEAVAWAKTMPDVRTAYAQCQNGMWLRWLLAESACLPVGPAWERYLCETRSLDKEYGDKCDPVESEHDSKLEVLNDKYEKENALGSTEYESDRALLYSEYHAKYEPLKAEYLSKLADAIRSLVSVEVFLKIFEEA